MKTGTAERQSHIHVGVMAARGEAIGDPSLPEESPSRDPLGLLLPYYLSLLRDFVWALLSQSLNPRQAPAQCLGISLLYLYSPIW